MHLSNLVQGWRWEHVGSWSPIITVGTVFLLSVGIAYRILPLRVNLVLYLLIALWVALLFLRWPHLGVIGLVPTSMLVGLVIDTGTGSRPNAPMLLVALLSGLWLLDMGVRHKQVYLMRSGPILPLIALVSTAVLAFGMGQLPWFVYATPAPIAAQLGGLGLFVLSAATFLLVAYQIRELKWLRHMTWVFLLLGAIFVAGWLAPELVPRRLFQRGVHGSLFWTWLTALAFGQVLFNRELRPRWRLALIGLVVATFSATWFQNRDWASVWAPPLVAIGTMFWLRSWRMGMFVTAAGIGAKLILDPGLLGALITSDWYSIYTRWAAWEIVLVQIASVSPILGLGPANYYHYTPLFPILGWYVEFNSHNQYVDLVAQTGLLGLVCFLWFAWAVGRLGWRLRERVPEGFARAYVYGSLAGLTGTLAAGMLGDWILPFVYNIGFTGFRSSMFAWLFLGGLVALEQMYLRNVYPDREPDVSRTAPNITRPSLF
jgi:hypothetical protein